jgi:hypothetical protein
MSEHDTSDGTHEAEVEAAERIAREVGAENPDPVTRREAIELELEDQGLSDAGESLGEHVE